MARKRRIVVADDRLGRTLQRIDDRRDDGRYRAVRRNGARRGQRRRSRRGRRRRRGRRGRRHHGSSRDGEGTGRELERVVGDSEGTVVNQDKIALVDGVNARLLARLALQASCETSNLVIDCTSKGIGQLRIGLTGNLRLIIRRHRDGRGIDNHVGRSAHRLVVRLGRPYLHRVGSNVDEDRINGRPALPIDRVFNGGIRLGSIRNDGRSPPVVGFGNARGDNRVLVRRCNHKLAVDHSYVVVIVFRIERSQRDIVAHILLARISGEAPVRNFAQVAFGNQLGHRAGEDRIIGVIDFGVAINVDGNSDRVDLCHNRIARPSLPATDNLDRHLGRINNIDELVCSELRVARPVFDDIAR